MKHSTFILAGIIAVIAGTAFATGENTTVATKGYVDNKFQDKITTGLVSLGDEWIENLPSLVSYDSASGLVGNKYGILDYNGSTEFIDDGWQNYQQDDETNLLIPTVGAVGRELQNMVNFIVSKQNKIPKSGYLNIGGAAVNAYNTNATSDSKSWLNAAVKGTGLVTRTSTDGAIGERKIFEASDVSGYHAAALTQNEKDIQDISIPTVGAMMTSLAEKQNLIPGYDSSTEYQSVLTDTTTDGVVGKMGILTASMNDGDTLDEWVGIETAIPTAGAVYDVAQGKIPAATTPTGLYTAGSVVTHTNSNGTVGERHIIDPQVFEDLVRGQASWNNDYRNMLITAGDVSYGLNSKQNKITAHAANAADSLLTDSTTDGHVQKRAIYDGSASYVAGTHATQIPTVGAMMAALSNGITKITWGATETTAVQKYSTTFDDTTNNWPAADAGKLVDGTGLATALAVKQNKKVCVGWPDDVEHTDANCWLWDFPD